MTQSGENICKASIDVAGNPRRRVMLPALESLSSVSVTDGQIDSWRAVLLCQLTATIAKLPGSRQLTRLNILNEQMKLQLIIFFNFRFPK